MRKLNTNPNIDNSNVLDYPDGRIKNNSGIGDGTPVDERIYGDLHQMVAKLMRLYGIIPNGLPDNETNGFQIIDGIKALASKNDYVLPLTTALGFLNVPIKLASLQENEQVVCKAGSNFTVETQIKGSDASTFTVSVLGSFKANEYVRLIKTGAGITLLRLTDNESIDSMVGALFYLKKASQAQENTGAVDIVSTTPLSNLTAFIRRVNGVDSGAYLASGLQNGIYPSAHYLIVAGLGASPVKNTGWFSGLDVGFSGAVGTNLPVSGDFSNAKYLFDPVTGNSNIEVTMVNVMANLNYKVRIDVESEGLIGIDNDCTNFVFKKLSTSKFTISSADLYGGTQNLKIHLEVIQL
jgi:hypothetical protein